MKSLIACLLALVAMAAGQSNTCKVLSIQDCTDPTTLRTFRCGRSIDTPCSIPAVRKTRQIRDDPSFVIVCGMAESLKLQGLMEHCLKTVEYWNCADPDRALIVSQNGKKAACLLVSE